ncbi:hypothetical protein GOD96_30860 [Sinorhizobium medicae]|nr:hypothetical protein [Sinorhizobium medicae]
MIYDIYGRFPAFTAHDWHMAHGMADRAGELLVPVQQKSHQVIAMNSLVLGKSRTVDASGLVEKNQVNCGLRPQPREQMAKSLLWKIHFWQIQEAD